MCKAPVLVPPSHVITWRRAAAAPKPGNNTAASKSTAWSPSLPPCPMPLGSHFANSDRTSTRDSSTTTSNEVDSGGSDQEQPLGGCTLPARDVPGSPGQLHWGQPVPKGWGLGVVRDTRGQKMDFHGGAVPLRYRKLQEQLDLKHLRTTQQEKTNHAGSQLCSLVNQSHCTFI